MASCEVRGVASCEVRGVASCEVRGVASFHFLEVIFSASSFLEMKATIHVHYPWLGSLCAKV